MKLKILFVDDDENILASFRSMLHSMRKVWKCRYASNAEAGLDMLREEKFDAIVADMRMPGMGGIEMLKRVEQMSPDTIRIVLSGYSDEQALLESARHAHQFLTKPCSSDCLIDSIRRAVRLRYILTDGTVRSAVTGMGALPVLPDHYLQINDELGKSEPDLRKIGTMVTQDLGLSATLMKVVNSSFFGFYQTVSDPSRAAVLLGTDILRGLIFGTHFFQEIDEEGLDGYSVDKLWNHCLQTGYLAKVIGAIETDDKSMIENCFVAGLLHDIGKLIMITGIPDKYGEVLREVAKNGGPMVKAERVVLGITHAEIGAYLLGLWGFREDVSMAVHCHHSLGSCSDTFQIGHAVHVANALQHELVPSRAGYVFSSVDTETLKDINMLDRLEVWREECTNMMEEWDAER